MADKNDVSGLPDVDLSPVMDQLKTDTSQTTSTPPADDLDLGQFKNPKDMLKSYKEIQAAFTKTTQENKQLREAAAKLDAMHAELERLKEERELAAQSAPQYQPQQSQDFESAWMEDPQRAIDARVAEQVRIARIQDVIAEEEARDRPSFMERSAYAQRLAQDPKYVHLGNSPAGVRKLFEIADKLRVEHAKTSARKSLEHIFGEPLTEEQLANMRKLVIGDRPAGQANNKTNSDAYMPDTSTSTATGADQSTGPDYNSMTNEAAEKGDVDGVIDAMFRGILAE